MISPRILLLLLAAVPSFSLRAARQGPTGDLAQTVEEEDMEKAAEDEKGEIAAAEAAARPPSPAAAGGRHGTAVCIVGQEGRLERESKLVNLLRPLHEDGYDPRVFLVLERGGATVYNNAYDNYRDRSPDFGQFQESSLDLVHTDYTQEKGLLTHWKSYRTIENFTDEERTRRLSNNKNQFRSWVECIKLVEKSELARGAQYDSVIKVRDNSIVLAPLDMRKLLSGRRVMTKACSRWRGISDKVSVLPREYADAYMRKPLQFLEFVTEGVKPFSMWAEKCQNPEQIVQTALARLPKDFAAPNELPIVDGRPLGNGSFCLVNPRKDCRPEHVDPTIQTCTGLSGAAEHEKKTGGD